MNTIPMEKKEDKKLLFKKWDSLNNNADNDFNISGPNNAIVEYNTYQVPERLSFSIGDSWTEIIDKKQYSYKVISIENIIIPAGKFKCFKIIEDFNGEARNHFWFAPDVGLIKWEIGKTKGVLHDYL